MKRVNKLLGKEEGFTIIEVVLVLAIAGLIFLVVFLALPQLQKSRRDTQRRNDASRMASALESYAGNSNGNYPQNATDLNSFVDTYITGQNFDDPSLGYQYGYGAQNTDGSGAVTGTPVVGAASTALDFGVWQYHTNAICGDNGNAEDSTGSRNVAIRMGLEQGIYCVDNQ